MKRKDVGDTIFRRVALVFPCLVLLIVAGIFFELVKSAWPSILKFGPAFLWRSTWDPVFEEYGAWPFIYGTLVSSFTALLIAIPVGVGTAVYLAEYAPQRLRRTISTFVDLLAAVPSVIYGLWAVFVLVPLMRTHVQPFLGKWFGFLPFFQGPNYGVGMLSASVILAIMIVPFIISISREVLLAVPHVYKEAAYALGSTRWEAVRALLSYGKTGIFGGVILALGRAIGETMAVTMIIGNQVTASASLFSPGYTLASVIANEFAEATTSLYVSALVEIALVLLLVSMFVNAAARVLIWSAGSGGAGKAHA